MPKTKKTPTLEPTPPTFEFVDNANQIGLYSDIFSVEMDIENGIVSMSFFQAASQLGKSFANQPGGEMVQVQKKDVRFLSRIILNVKSFEALLTAMAQNYANAQQQLEAKRLEQE